MNEKNLIKRFLIWYLLWWSEDDFMAIGGLATGAVLGAALNLILTLLNIATVKQPIELYILVTSLLGAVVFVMIRKKYISHVDDYSATALLWHDGKAFAAKARWGKNVLPINLPALTEGKISFNDQKVYTVGGRWVRIMTHYTITIALHEDEFLLGFNADELFKIAFNDRTTDVSVWLRVKFQKVQEAEIAGLLLRVDDPIAFARRAKVLLEMADFRSKVADLTNITSVKAKVDWEIVPIPGP